MKIILVCLILILFSCSVAKDTSSTKLGERFTYEQQVAPGSVYGVCVITDTQTQQEYLLIRSFYNDLQIIKLEKDTAK